MNVRKQLKELSGAAFIAVLLGCSMSMTLLDALAVSFAMWKAILISAFTSLSCVLLLIGRVPALITGLCLGGGAVLSLFREHNWLIELKETLIALLMLLVGGESSIRDHTLMLAISITVISTLLAFLMTRLSGGIYPALMLFMFVLLGSWFIEKRLIPMHVVPGLAGLAVLYARSHQETIGYMKAVPIALLAALLAVAFVPAGNTTWPPLADAAQKVRELFADYFLFTAPRTVYSVSSDGYQPQGDVLGGAAKPRDAEIMTVRTDKNLLLRGSIRRTYTGYSWVDNSINSRYLFIDPSKQALRNDVFDIEKISALRNILTESKISVTMLNDGTSTLFVPHRVESLSAPLDVVAYFNDSGEVFITRGVTYGDHYELTAYLPNANSLQISQTVSGIPKGTDPDYQNIADTHMNLPLGLDNEVYWLTMALTEDIASPYEKALAIQEHLLSAEYTYMLDVPFPPKGRDFVSYFLLDSKQGYCTYYASAMAVMARLAGLPSRYVEGYMVTADPSGETLVRGENAHAWVEIYFEGVGWLPFDATPGGFEDNGDQQDKPPASTPTPPPNEGEHSGNNSPEITPSPSPSPSPSPTPAPESDSANQPTPTPEPSPQPSEWPQDSPEDRAADDNTHWWKALLWILLILLLLLLLAVLLRYRWSMVNPRMLSKKQDDDTTRLMLWYRVILMLLARMGFAPEGGETPEKFVHRLMENGIADEQMLELAYAVQRQQYARISADEQTIQLAESIYGKMIAQMKPQERFNWYTNCMIHGLDNFHQIP